MNSPRFKLNKKDIFKVMKGAGVGLSGLLLSSVHEGVAEWVGSGSLGSLTPIGVVGYGVLSNLARKLFSK